MTTRLQIIFRSAVAALVLAAGEACAQLTLYDPTGARSVSGQFVIRVERERSLFEREPGFVNAPELVRLDAPQLATSCERIKQTLLAQLRDKTQWRGRILLSLSPAQTADDEIIFITEKFKDGWGYRLDVPNPVQRTRLVRAVVQAILQERVNRGSRGRSTEIPLWLSEGLTQWLIASQGLEVLLPPPAQLVNGLRLSPVFVDARRTNAVTLAMLGLGDRGPISLEELSWPKDGQLAGPDAVAFAQSAQLFVGELLRFQDGPDCFRAFLDELPGFLNWQTTFLRGFGPHFARQVDLEKWWTLQIVSRTGRDVRSLWTLEESWKKLDELIAVQTQVRRTRNELPVPAEVPLATVIREWDFVRQSQALRNKLNELNGARQRVAEELVPVVDDYRHLIQNFLSQRDRLGAVLPDGRGSRPAARSLVRETLKTIEAIEERRQKSRPGVTPVEDAVSAR
jgi:hypothetical protein